MTGHTVVPQPHASGGDADRPAEMFQLDRATCLTLLRTQHVGRLVIGGDEPAVVPVNFTAVDEVEVADNLWASLIGFYAYAILFPAWWLLSRIRLAGPPDQWVIYGVAMLTATAAYAYRKWQSR